MERPPNIQHYRAIQEADDSHYPGSDELLSIGSPFGRQLGLKRLGIHHELLPPGRRTSWPHAESNEEEFVYVIEGYPQVWINGHLHSLTPGDGVAFPAGTGIAHTFINNTRSDVRLLVVGEATKADNRIYYPLNPERKQECAAHWWEEAPVQELGSHDGLPDKLRQPESPPDPYLPAIEGYGHLAQELDIAARHAQVAARHFSESDVPRGCAHGMASQGHMLKAQAHWEELANLQAEKARLV